MSSKKGDKAPKTEDKSKTSTEKPKEVKEVPSPTQGWFEYYIID